LIEAGQNLLEILVFKGALEFELRVSDLLSRHFTT
jgi:hypothetical protein